jgi:hypothetical protein
MKTRTLVAIISGVLIAGFFILIFEEIGHRIFPAAIKLDLNNKDKYMDSVPFMGKMMVVISWLIGTLVGSVFTLFIDGRQSFKPGFLVAFLLQLFAVYNLISIPSPLWMWIASFMVFVPISYLIYRKLQKIPKEEIKISDEPEVKPN